MRRAARAAHCSRYSLGALLPGEVDIAVTHCGVCHSDLHLIDDDWGMSAFPLVPGHEIVGASPGELRVPVFGLLEGQKNIGGSAIGPNAEMRAMLEFAAAHAVQPMSESYSMSTISDVLQRLRANRVRYRAVLVNNDENFRG